MSDGRAGRSRAFACRSQFKVIRSPFIDHLLNQRQPTAAPRSGVGWWAWFESNFIFLICSESVSSAQFQFALPSSFAFATEHRLMFERQPTAAPRSGVGWWAWLETIFLFSAPRPFSLECLFTLPSSFNFISRASSLAFPTSAHSRAAERRRLMGLVGNKFPSFCSETVFCGMSFHFAKFIQLHQ